MTTEKFAGTISSAYGQPLAKSLKFSGTYEAYATIEELQAEKDDLTDHERLEYRNNQKKANARQKAMQVVLDVAGVQKPTLEDPEVALKNMIRAMVAQGHSEARATQICTAALSAPKSE